MGQLLLALHLVFEQDSTCGLRKIARFLELTQLDRVVAATCGNLPNSVCLAREPAR